MTLITQSCVIFQTGLQGAKPSLTVRFNALSTFLAIISTFKAFNECLLFTV